MISMWHSGMAFSYHSSLRSAKALLMAYFCRYSFLRLLGLLPTLSVCRSYYFYLVKANVFFWLC